MIYVLNMYFPKLSAGTAFFRGHRNAGRGARCFTKNLLALPCEVSSGASLVRTKVGLKIETQERDEKREKRTREEEKERRRERERETRREIERRERGREMEREGERERRERERERDMIERK